MRFFIAFLCCFLSLDRYMAVCRVDTYRKLNVKKFILGSLFVSIVISILEFDYLFEHRIAIMTIRLDSTHTSVQYSFNEIDNDKNYNLKIMSNQFYIKCTVLGIKFFLLIGLIFFGLCIIMKLHKRKVEVV